MICACNLLSELTSLFSLALLHLSCNISNILCLTLFFTTLLFMFLPLSPFTFPLPLRFPQVSSNEQKIFLFILKKMISECIWMSYNLTGTHTTKSLAAQGTKYYKDSGQFRLNSLFLPTIHFDFFFHNDLLIISQFSD